MATDCDAAHICADDDQFLTVVAVEFGCSAGKRCVVECQKATPPRQSIRQFGYWPSCKRNLPARRNEDIARCQNDGFDIRATFGWFELSSPFGERHL